MRGNGKGPAREAEDYEDQILHQTLSATRIRSHTAKYGSHRIHRHQRFTGSASSSPSNASAPGAAGASASSVSAYLEHMPSNSLGNAPPPRPPRPPGGLLGISNGRGIGYGRSLGSSYDSPLTIHGSFNGHVRSGANLYGGKNQSSGLLPTRPSAGHQRPSMSVFPIQKALEIAMKESRLLAAASSRGGAGPSGTGMSTGTTFVRQLRRARHARGAIITEHGPTPDISLDEEEEEEGQDEEERSRDVYADASTGSGLDHDPSTSSNSWHGLMHDQDDTGIRRPALASFDVKGHYPGIAYLPHTTSHSTGALSLTSSGSLRNSSPNAWDRRSGLILSPSAALASSSAGSSSSSSRPRSTAYSQTLPDHLFSLDATTRTPYQSHFSPVLSSSSLFSSTHALYGNRPSSSSLYPSSSAHDAPTRSAVEAVRELLDSYPAPSPYCVDDKNRSPLHFAAASGDLELVEFLLERGVRPDCGRDIAGNMPLHLAIISNRVDVVAALLKAGADMTLASPMTHKTPLDLAESRLSYLLSRAQESVRQPRPSGLDLFNSQIATRSSFQAPPTQSPALLYQIRGIVNLLRPYVVRQQKLQHGERQKDRQKERSWDRADKYMQYNDTETMGSNSSSGRGLWRVDSHSADDEGEDEEDNDDMDTGDRQAATRRRPAGMDMDGDVELSHGRREARQAGRRMDADQAEEALETLMNGLSLLEASRRQQQQEQEDVSDATDGNLADSELDTRSEQEVDSALPDLLEQVQQVLEAIKLNETS